MVWKVSLPHGWFLVRGSNTEPIIRVIAEAQSEVDARRSSRKYIRGFRTVLANREWLRLVTRGETWKSLTH